MIVHPLFAALSSPRGRESETLTGRLPTGNAKTPPIGHLFEFLRRAVFRREDDSFNKETFFGFMKQLKQAACRTGRRVVVITDNANYHHANLHKAWRLSHAGHFELHFLPPYSPDLNPIERTWKLTRRLCLHNRYFPVLDDIVSVVEGLFETWSRSGSTLRRLCAIT
jgi:transposase